MSRQVWWSAVVLAVFALACAKHEVKQPSAPPAPSAQKSAPRGNRAADKAKTEEPVTKGGVTVAEAGACRSLENRNPVGQAEVFPANVGRVYLFTTVSLEKQGETSIQHVWNYDGKKMATVKLPVRAARWRTYSSKSIDPSQKGEWRVDILTAESEFIRSVTFRVE